MLRISLRAAGTGCHRAQSPGSHRRGAAVRASATALTHTQIAATGLFCRCTTRRGSENETSSFLAAAMCCRSPSRCVVALGGELCAPGPTSASHVPPTPARRTTGSAITHGRRASSSAGLSASARSNAA